MEYTVEDRGNIAIEECLKCNEKDPITIFKTIANKMFIRIHGPEHHILDGLCILTAYYNAGGNIVLKDSLEKLMKEGLRMPGAICGLWGVCGSVASIGAALAVIDGTGPLTNDPSWGNHMKYTSKALEAMSKVGGPRCCKRNAFISLSVAVDFLNENYNVIIPKTNIECEYYKKNEQCIRERCPYYKEV